MPTGYPSRPAPDASERWPSWDTAWQDYQREQASGAQQQSQWDPANPYRDWEFTRRVNPTYPVFDAEGNHVGLTRDDAAHAAYLHGMELLGAQHNDMEQM